MAAGSDSLVADEEDDFVPGDDDEQDSLNEGFTMKSGQESTTQRLTGRRSKFGRKFLSDDQKQVFKVRDLNRLLRRGSGSGDDEETEALIGQLGTSVDVAKECYGPKCGAV